MSEVMNLILEDEDLIESLRVLLDDAAVALCSSAHGSSRVRAASGSGLHRSRAPADAAH